MHQCQPIHIYSVARIAKFKNNLDLGITYKGLCKQTGITVLKYHLADVHTVRYPSSHPQLPAFARIHFKNIFLVYKAFLGLAPSYLSKLIMRPVSAISDRPLRSLVRNDLLVPRSRTSTSQQCAFASAGPLL